MGEVNVVLKRLFTIFNIIFAVVGGVILCLALLSQILTSSHGDLVAHRAAGLLVLYLVGAITMVVAILGAYGAHRENKGCLIAFLVCTLIGGLAMVRIGLPAAAGRSNLEPLLRREFQRLVPLDQTEQTVQNTFNSLQSKLHCCGIFNYDNWENVPESCECDTEAREAGECRTVTQNYMASKTIYSKPCFPTILYYVELVDDIGIGVALTLAALAVLGVIMSSIMIHQMRYGGVGHRPTVLLSVPTVFSPAPPKYQELHNPPSY